MINHRIRAKVVGLSLIEAKAADDAGDLGRLRRARVEMGVADIGGARRIKARPLDHQMQKVGQRLLPPRTQRVATDDRIEPIGQPQFAKQFTRQMLHLVGDDGDLDPARIQIIQHVRPARKQA